MRFSPFPGFIVIGVSLAALALSGCAADTSSGTSPSGAAGDGKVAIVASTNVYGDIATEIGGDLIDVTSLITGAAQDPHSYEASAQDQLALSKAQLVIENGGGYDPFIDTLLGAADSKPVVVSAVDASGLVGDSTEGFNEHVWYSLQGTQSVAEEIAHQLGELDVENAAVYTANYETFAARIAELEAKAEALHSATDGRGAAITEPVPLYLLEAAGLTNATPEAFSEAIEEGTDVAPLVLRETVDLFSGGDVAVLAYNAQTAGPETERVRLAAETAGVPVVEFTETMPKGANYISWMTENLDKLAAAVK